MSGHWCPVTRSDFMTWYNYNLFFLWQLKLLPIGWSQCLILLPTLCIVCNWFSSLYLKYYSLNVKQESISRVKQKDYEIGICCFSVKHVASRSKTKDWLSQNLVNVSEWRNMFICGLLFQWDSTKVIQLIRVDLVQSGYHLHLIKM